MSRLWRAIHRSLIAYDLLAGAHDRIYFLGFDHTEARLQLAETAIQSIRRLSPESGETHLAFAHHLYWAYADYDRAKEELAVARRTLPNESRIPLMSGYIDRRQGRWEKSLEEMKQALELDPHNFSILQQISLTYQALRRYKEMAATLDSALAIAPKDVPSRVRRAWVDLEWRADPKPLHTTIETILARGPERGACCRLSLARPCLTRARSRRGRAGASRHASPAADVTMKTFRFLTVGARVLLPGSAAMSRQRAMRLLEREKNSSRSCAISPTTPAALCALGVVDAALGNKDDAIREGERAVELIPVSKSAIEGPMLIQYLAVIYAWTGDKDRAIERLAEAAKLPGSHVSYGYLRLNPLWDPLRGDPRFEAIVASLAPKY